MSARRGMSYALRLIFTTAERKFNKHPFKAFYGSSTKNNEKSNIERVENIAMNLSSFLKDGKQQLSQVNHQLEETRKEVTKPFEHAERLISNPN